MTRTTVLPNAYPPMAPAYVDAFLSIVEAYATWSGLVYRAYALTTTRNTLVLAVWP